MRCLLCVTCTNPTGTSSVRQDRRRLHTDVQPEPERQSQNTANRFGGMARASAKRRRRKDDAAGASVLPAVVDGTVRIGTASGRGGGHTSSGLGGDIRSARSVAASAILSVVVIAAAGVLSVVATAAAGVLAVAVLAAAAVTGRTIRRLLSLRRELRFRLRTMRTPSMRAGAPTTPTMPKVTPTLALFAKNPLEVAPAIGSADTVAVEPAVFGRKFGPVLVPSYSPVGRITKRPSLSSRGCWTRS